MSQQQKYPVGTKLRTVKACPGTVHNGKAYGAFLVGALAEVTGHTDDGRAKFYINDDIHTFDLPEYYMEVIELPTGDSMSKQWNDTEIWKAIREAQPVPGSALSVDRVFALMREMRDELTAQYAAERDEKRKLRQILAVKLALFDSEIDDMLAQTDAE